MCWRAAQGNHHTLTEPFMPPSANWQHRDPETGSVAMATPHRFRGRKAEPRNLQSLLSLSVLSLPVSLLDMKYHSSVRRIMKWRSYQTSSSEQLQLITSSAISCRGPFSTILDLPFLHLKYHHSSECFLLSINNCHWSKCNSLPILKLWVLLLSC